MCVCVEQNQCDSWVQSNKIVLNQVTELRNQICCKTVQPIQPTGVTNQDADETA